MMLVTIYIFLFIELLFVGILDFKYKKISNYWHVVNIALFVFLLFSFPNLYQLSWQTFFFPLVFLLVGYLSFLIKLVGAGDTKFLFGLYLLIPYPLHEEAFLCLAYTTVVVGLFLFFQNTVKNFDRILVAWKTKDTSLIKGVYGKKFSFAPVIFISWIWFGWENYKAFIN